jgi:hypothetical protein
MICLISACI